MKVEISTQYISHFEKDINRIKAIEKRNVKRRMIKSSHTLCKKGVINLQFPSRLFL